MMIQLNREEETKEVREAHVKLASEMKQDREKAEMFSRKIINPL